MGGGNLTLTPLVESDLEFLRQVRSHPEISQYLFSPNKPISPEEQRAWFAIYEQRRDTRIWVAHNESWRCVGYAQATDWDVWHKSCQAGFCISPDCQGQGYGTLLVRAFLKTLPSHFPVHRVEVRVFTDNLRAIHVYEKCGFEHEGLLREAIWKDGTFRDICLMSYLYGEDVYEPA